MSDKQSAIDEILAHVRDYIAEGEKDPQFAGMVIDEQRDSEGKLLSVRLVLCDNIMGNACRRAE